MRWIHTSLYGPARSRAKSAVFARDLRHLRRRGTVPVPGRGSTRHSMRPGLKHQILRLLLLSLAAFLSVGTVHAERVEDLASVAGVRTNQLVGYGLVVGLDGTGDQTSQTPFTI